MNERELIGNPFKELSLIKNPNFNELFLEIQNKLLGPFCEDKTSIIKNVHQAGFDMFTLCINGFAGHLQYLAITNYVLGENIADKCEFIEIDRKSSNSDEYNKKYNMFNPEFLFSAYIDTGIARKNNTKNHGIYLRHEQLTDEDINIIKERTELMINIFKESEKYYNPHETSIRRSNPWKYLIFHLKELYAKIDPDSNKDFIIKGEILKWSKGDDYSHPGLILKTETKGSLILINSQKEDSEKYIGKKAIAIYTRNNIETGDLHGRLIKIIK